jgi:kynureninase
VLTGWFSEFAALERAAGGGRVQYGEGAARFSGATYDPASHYRAAAVFAFHAEQDLTAERLREISRRQIARLLQTFESLDLDPTIAHVEPMPAERRGGFLAIRCARAAELSRWLRDRSVFTDARGDLLRLGPAPYLTDRQLRDAVAVLQGIPSDGGRGRALAPDG